jgi:hypothetical protein
LLGLAWTRDVLTLASASGALDVAGKTLELLPLLDLAEDIGTAGLERIGKDWEVPRSSQFG